MKPDHEPVIVTETPDNPVVRQRDLQQSLEPIRTEMVKHRIGLVVLAAMIASPKIGGPTATEAVTAVADIFGWIATAVIATVAASVLLIVDALTK